MSAAKVSVFYVRQIVPREKPPNHALSEEELKPHVVDVAKFFERTHADAEATRRGSNHFVAEMLEDEAAQHPAHQHLSLDDFVRGIAGSAGFKSYPPSKL